MDKPIIYIPRQNFYIDDLYDFINERVKLRVLNELSNYFNESKKHIDKNKKKVFFMNEATKLHNQVNYDLFDIRFLFKVVFEENLCFISESSLQFIIENYKTNDEISVYGNELLDIVYSLEYYTIVEINDPDTYISKFYEVKGDENNGLLKQIINYILVDTLTHCHDELDKNHELLEFKNQFTKENNFKQVTINGKKINLKERFLIANEVLKIETKIRTLKISESAKHELLSIILGCNLDNAKKIMNGNYDVKIKENLLEDYYKTLNL